MNFLLRVHEYFLARMLFSVLVSLGLIYTLLIISPDAPFWMAVFIGFLFDIVLAISYTHSSNLEKYIAHLEQFFYSSTLGIGLAYGLWAIYHEVSYGSSISIGVAMATLVLFERGYIWGEVREIADEESSTKNG